MIIAAERARAAIADEPFAGVGRITISIGLCALTDATDAKQLMSHADQALYSAKQAGRNRTVSYAETRPEHPSD